MEITVSARHIDISPALRAAAEDKIGRLSRFGGGIDRAVVHFLEERNPRIADKEVCEVKLEGGGVTLLAKAAAADTFAAIDLVVEKLEHQLHSLKNRLVTRQHDARRPAALVPDLDLDDS
ncbi:MAG: ribosome-associated translation inhibitor RaiA [Acidimicrobiales bacterium]|nr:ribosome-associated translation inhibitor RaiA [Acidimicrobiales bacterium]